MRPITPMKGIPNIDARNATRPNTLVRGCVRLNKSPTINGLKIKMVISMIRYFLDILANYSISVMEGHRTGYRN
jgi:hypothetical protein